MRFQFSARAAAAGVAALVAAGSLAAAALWGNHNTSDHGPAAAVNVEERDFKITAPERLAPGDIRLRITNKGPDRHEFIVVRLPTSGSLPERTDGITIDEDRIGEAAEPGSLESGLPGSVRTLDVHLAAGRYQFFCNMSGHYWGGMHTDVVVG